MNIVLIGVKSSGKSTLGKKLSEKLGIKFIETDDLIEKSFNAQEGIVKKCNEIYDYLGDEQFRILEEEAVHDINALDWKVIITGGSTFLSSHNRKILRKDAIIIYCQCNEENLIKRLNKDIHYAPGLSKAVFLDWYKKDIVQKNELYKTFADIIINTSDEDLDNLIDKTYELLNEELAIRTQHPNTIGEIIKLTTFGESHGQAIGAVLDGIPSGIDLNENDIQKELDRRKPGQSKITTPRAESDKINILSGVFNNKTTGSPIALIIYNKDSDSSKYEEIKNMFRPGHADFTFFHKYLIRDYRGGGRSSGRETASRVAGGAIAKKILADRNVKIYAHTLAIGGIKANNINYDEIENNILRCADKNKVPDMIEKIDKVRKESDSIGGIVQLDIIGLPPGLGDPVFAKLDARITYALMSIGSVKGIEIGTGFECANTTGSTNNDQMSNGKFLSNNAGGILGGISTGEPVIIKLAIKPTPSILKEQKTITTDSKNSSISVKGRHDPCILPRIIPVIESMAALILLDIWEIQSRLNNTWNKRINNDN